MKIRAFIFCSMIVGVLCLIVASDDEDMKTCQKTYSAATCLKMLR